MLTGSDRRKAPRSYSIIIAVYSGILDMDASRNTDLSVRGVPEVSEWPKYPSYRVVPFWTTFSAQPGMPLSTKLCSSRLILKMPIMPDTAMAAVSALSSHRNAEI